MTNTDKLDRIVRIAFGILFFVIAAVFVHNLSVVFGANEWLTFGILSLGYLVGRVARGIER